MLKHEIEEKYFREYLIWCSAPPEGKVGDVIFWMDYRYPTTDNFWEWVVTCKQDVLKAPDTAIDFS